MARRGENTTALEAQLDDIEQALNAAQTSDDLDAVEHQLDDFENARAIMALRVKLKPRLRITLERIRVIQVKTKTMKSQKNLNNQKSQKPLKSLSPQVKPFLYSSFTGPVSLYTCIL